ncbi:MAG TPA: YceI family protein [Planctomycetota bacterium]|nr:YceI family protein [Planctomycetota bacterium]
MTARLLQSLGVVFVLGLVAASFGALLVLRDRVRIVVQQDQVPAGPDATALLRDDVLVLTRRTDELQAASAANFERLGNALEQRAEARHEDVLALRAQVDRLRAQLDEQRSAVDALDRRLQQAPAPNDAAVQATDPVAAPPPPAVAEPAPAPVADAKSAAKGTGFLSFTLPSTAFHFDAPQDYTLVPALCRVGFDAKSTLHDFTGATSNVAGHFRADFDDPDGAWTGEVTAEAGKLVTGVDGRDSSMWEYLDAKDHPQIRFEIVRFRPAAGGVDVERQTARGDIVGRMTIHGQTRELTMPVHIEVDPQKRVVVTGQAPLKLSDYGVPVPSQLGVINMQDEVVVWVALRARVQAETRK